MSFKHKYCIKTRKFHTALFCNTDNNGIFIEEPDFTIGGTNVVNGSSRTRDRSLSQGIIGKKATLKCMVKLNNDSVTDKIPQFYVKFDLHCFRF